MPDETLIRIVMEGPPSPYKPHNSFIETELPDGTGIGVGTWVQLHPDGDGPDYWALEMLVPTNTIRFPKGYEAPPEGPESP